MSRGLTPPPFPTVPPASRSPSVIFQTPPPHLQKHNNDKKSPRLHFLPLGGNQIWNNKYILHPPGKALLVTNTYRLIVLIRRDRGEMLGSSLMKLHLCV